MKASRTLVELRAANAIMARANRLRPQGFRSSLKTERSGPSVEVDDEVIDWARKVLRIVNAVEPLHFRRLLSFIMDTEKGQPRHSRERLAKHLGISPATLKRWLREALAIVEVELARAEPVRPVFTFCVPAGDRAAA